MEEIGTNKVEFGAATDYINAANTKLNVRSNNPLWIDVSSIKMGNDLDTGSPDYAMVIEKDIDSETLTSNTASKPVWKLSNTNATAAQAGAIVEFSKTATQDDAIMGSIKSSTGDGTFAQVDFKGEGNTASQTGSMVFTTYEGGVAKQVMDLSATNANTVTIGTGSNDANLKVYGTLTAASTAYENDILPATRGGAGLGQSTREWDDLWIYDAGFASFGGHNITAVTLTHDDGFGDTNPGLILDTDSRLYFDDVNQHIGRKNGEAGVLEIVSATEVEINAGPLLDLDANSVTVDANSVAINAAQSDGVAITAALGNIELNTPSNKAVVLKSNQAVTVSHVSDGGAQDFTIAQTGAVDASLFINSAGTAADAIALTASAGGIDILASGAAAGEDIDITATGSSVNLSSNEAVADAIALTASAGGLDIDGVNSTIAITNTTDGDEDDITISTVNANNSSIILSSAGNGTDAIALTAAAGDIDIDAANVTMDATAGVSIQGATASDLTVAGSGETLTLEASGGGTNQVIISSAGTGTDALDINAPNGGIDIDAAVGSAVALNAGSFNITSNTSNTGTVKVIGADAESAKLFLSADEDDSNADKWLIAAADDGAVTISNTADGSTFSPKLTIASDGTVTAGSFSGNMNSNDLQTDQVMTIASSNVAAVAVDLDASAGGAAIDAVKASNFTVTGSGESLTLSAAGGGAQKVIVNSAGTGEDAIQLNATAGGVDIDALAAKDVNVAGGQVALVSKDDAASAISLTTNIGTSETIVVTNTQGTGSGALTFTATAGGVDIDGADEVNIGSSKDDPAAIVIDASAGGVDILASDAAAGEDIDISATGSSVNLSSNEAVADAITLNASAGGIDITSAGVMDITTSAGNSNITIDPNGSGTLALGSADNTAVTVDAISFSIHTETNHGFIRRRYQPNPKSHIHYYFILCVICP